MDEWKGLMQYFNKILNFKFVDFNWILLVIGVVYTSVSSFIWPLRILGESKLSPPSTQKQPLPKIILKKYHGQFRGQSWAIPVKTTFLILKCRCKKMKDYRVKYLHVVFLGTGQNGSKFMGYPGRGYRQGGLFFEKKN